MFIKTVNTVSSNVSKQHARTCNSYSYKQGETDIFIRCLLEFYLLYFLMLHFLILSP